MVKYQHRKLLFQNERYNKNILLLSEETTTKVTFQWPNHFNIIENETASTVATEGSKLNHIPMKEYHSARASNT